MEKGTMRLLLYVAVYIAYLCIGSLIFATIEAPVEERELEKLKRLRMEFLNDNRCVDDKALEYYVLQVIKATKNGIKPIKNVTTFPNWDYASAFLFSGTLVTTIGYGEIAPLSNSGKIFAIFFALFGIPMTAILLTAIVERFLHVVELVEKFMERNYLTQPALPRSLVRAVNVSILIIIIVTCVLLLPAAIFTLIEKWGYFEALYFCFITLTTIGLGDYTPGDGEGWVDNHYRSLYKISCVVYFLVGLSFIVLILEMCAKVPDDHPGMLFSCHKPILDDETEMEPLGSKGKPSYGRDRDEGEDSANDYELLSGEDKDRSYPSP